MTTAIISLIFIQSWPHSQQNLPLFLSNYGLRNVFVVLKAACFYSSCLSCAIFSVFALFTLFVRCQTHVAKYLMVSFRRVPTKINKKLSQTSFFLMTFTLSVAFQYINSGTELFFSTICCVWELTATADIKTVIVRSACSQVVAVAETQVEHIKVFFWRVTANKLVCALADNKYNVTVNSQTPVVYDA